VKLPHETVGGASSSWLEEAVDVDEVFAEAAKTASGDFFVSLL
jgi:hypothetical protein